MIIIISESTDSFTSDIENWLNYYKKKYLRINIGKAIEFFSWKLSNDCCDISVSEETKHQEIFLTNSIVWHRRGRIIHALHFHPEDLEPEYLDFIHKESLSLFDATMMVLNDKNLLKGTHIFKQDNRLYNQYLAIKFGFSTPATLVTSSKKKLEEFKFSYPKLITKPISEVFKRTVAGQHLRGEVKSVNEETIKLLPENFFPMLFQEKIVRRFEVRVFYFLGNYFSMAVLLENDENARIDIWIFRF